MSNGGRTRKGAQGEMLLVFDRHGSPGEPILFGPSLLGAMASQSFFKTLTPLVRKAVQFPLNSPHFVQLLT